MGRKMHETSESAGLYQPCPIYTAGELRQMMKEKARQERKRGYCELCEVKYDNIDKVSGLGVCDPQKIDYVCRCLSYASNKLIYVVGRSKESNFWWHVNT